MSKNLDIGNKPARPRASVQALGCRLNQYEGLSLEGKLRDAGYDVVPFGEKQILVLSTHVRLQMKQIPSQEMQSVVLIDKILSL